jgi:hypothetical protein
MDLTGASQTVLLASLEAVPAMAPGGTGTGAYAAVTGPAKNGLLYSFGLGQSNPLVTETGMAVLLGVASHAGNAYFTAGGVGALDLYENVNGAVSSTLYTGAMATGPVAADSFGVYWPASDGEMMRINLDGSGVQPISKWAEAVYAMVTDGVGFLYWTDQGGNVFRVASHVPDAGSLQNLNGNTTANPAYGIAVDTGGTHVFFAKDDSVYLAQFPTWNTSLVASGLGHPHGLALDGNGTTLYIADNGNPPSTDGRILRMTVP